ncbi:MAG: hypothetical protein EBZ76_04310 [Synechococcaceae bacterium WB9_2_170]|nr:hypothetical protein [Synechococcaceae bacterium WB9_2_170]
MVVRGGGGRISQAVELGVAQHQQHPLPPVGQDSRIHRQQGLAGSLGVAPAAFAVEPFQGGIGLGDGVLV